MTFTLPQVPKEYLIVALLGVCLVLLLFNINHGIFAVVIAIASYILGKDIGIIRGKNETL